ncbi:hypothetical protein BUALT_Bualt03G0107600 [Buddleja alternifolia]|uniref:Armadillo repeat-containing protein 4 n=1 Tax=Buddleja alternifolia TaxID=168488 RepID=A0AAV6XT54_9LAMI|nr:hypothetical protein BUALT_Bualt03G0107600 [Buddleja alternifolia]
MEGSEGKQVESSKGRNWDEAFNLYANVIANENDSIRIQATIKLAKMSRCAPENVLALTVPILLELLESSNKSVLEASAYCLKCIASQGEGRLANLIGQSGGIPILLRLLPNSEEGLQRSLLKCVRNIITFCVPNRMILVNNGGMEIVIAMLNSCSDGSKLILLEILSALSLIREVRKFLWNSRSVHHLVEAARYGSLISRTRAAHAIGFLGSIKKARRTLVDAGAVIALMNLLKDGDSSMKLVAGNSLGVISSHVDHIRPVAQVGVIPLYAELLGGSDPIGKEIAEDVFCILAVNEENAVTIIEHLVRILRGDNTEAKAAAADVIWDLSSYNYSLPILQNSGVIPILVELLKDENMDVTEKVAGAIAQLSQNKADRAVLADCGAIPILIDMLRDESDELRDNAAEALVNFSMDPLLRDHISCVLDNPLFQNMRDRVIQMRASDEHMDASLRQISTEQLTWDPGLV